MSERYQLADLLYLMQRLRDPDGGCPWDRQQTFATIVPFTLEEAYEVADTIEREDFAHLKDELGDLLFQVVFYAQMGQEQDLFGFADVVDGIVRKLLRRHPHVFPDGTLTSRVTAENRPTEAQIKLQWERIKKDERDAKLAAGMEGRSASILDDVPQGFPALARAEKLQKRASQEGFDWDEIAPVFDKIQEEISEVQEVLAQEQNTAERQRKLEDEMGDVLFACVNLARFLKVNPEAALRQTNRKFESRFRQIEALLVARGKVLGETSLDELDALWNEVKQREKASG